MDEQQGLNSQVVEVSTPSTPTESSPQTPPTPTVGKTEGFTTREKWLSYLKEYEVTGGSQNAFCNNRGINPGTFSSWWSRYRLLGESGLRKRSQGSPHYGSWSPDERRMAVEGYLKSGMNISDFARLWGVGDEPLKIWVMRYEAGGPKALENRVLSPGRPRRKGVRELIEKVKQENPTFGFRKVRDFLGRISGVKVSAGSVRNALKDKGYPKGGRKRRRQKRQPPRRFERAVAGDLWQTDITSFVLPRHGQRVYLTVFLDDYSRYIVSWALALQQKQELVIEALLSGIDRFGKPREVLSDQGRQYVSWRGRGDFRKMLDKQGIGHVVAKTHHPQTVGKTERFWATVMEEFWGRVQPQELTEARERLGHFINHYNHFRPHQGIDGMVPADRFFGVEKQVRKAIEDQMAKNELHLALGEAPRTPMYLVGQIGDQQVSMHGEKGRMVIQTPDGRVQELGMEGLGMGPREAGDGRRKQEREEAPIQRPGEAEVQVPIESTPSDEGIVGIGHAGGEGKGASDGGADARILDRSFEEGRSGGEIGGATATGVADVAAGVVGDGGGVGEAAESGQEEVTGSPAPGPGPEGVEQESPGFGEGPGTDEGTGEVAAGATGQPGGAEEG
jgi:transposase InsO family protein